MSTIRRFPGLHCLIILVGLLGATLACKGCGEHECAECECDCSEPEPGVGGGGGEAGAPGTGGEDGEGGEAGGGPVLRPNGAEFETFEEDPYL